jgi:predicted RNA-binding protein with PUA-like domain
MKYWLVKQEPEDYSFDDLIKEGETDWTGVRNYQARNNLRSMKKGDKVLFYHSGSEKAVVGLTEVTEEHFPDPTDTNWLAVKIKPLKKFTKPVPLATIKSQKSLQNIALVRQPRLSVMPLSEEEFNTILKLAE